MSFKIYDIKPLNVLVFPVKQETYRGDILKIDDAGNAVSISIPEWEELPDDKKGIACSYSQNGGNVYVCLEKDLKASL